MKYVILTMQYSKSLPEYFYTSYVYDYTNDLESAIFIGLHLLGDDIDRVHVKENMCLGDVKAVIMKHGPVTSPEVLVRI